MRQTQSVPSCPLDTHRNALTHSPSRNTALHTNHMFIYGMRDYPRARLTVLELRVPPCRGVAKGPGANMLPCPRVSFPCGSWPGLYLKSCGVLRASLSPALVHEVHSSSASEAASSLTASSLKILRLWPYSGRATCQHASQS